MARTIAFKRDSSVHPGLNCTVRSGDKWANVKQGEKVNLADETGIFGEATVVSATRYADFKALVENESSISLVLRFEHVERARNLQGLVDAMYHAYGDGWSLYPVVVVFFWV